jgi:cysteine desulfurase
MDQPALIYLDNQATTPCDPRVIAAMEPYWREEFGNPASRSHRFGTRAKNAVETARTQVAKLLGASPKEIIWTSGATEANNLALFGVMAGLEQSEKPHLITAVTEHSSILDPATELLERGFEVTTLNVNQAGFIDLAELEDAIRPNTALISIMAANNETGVLQPLAAIGQLCRRHEIVFHTDAAQAAGKIPLPVKELGIDLCSLSAHKLYGPKGIGALYVRRGRPRVRLKPLVYGGGHERGLRSGTLPVPLIVGLGAAASLCEEELKTGALDRLASLRDELWAELQRRLDGVHLNGDPTARLANNLNLSIDGVDSETLLVSLPSLAISTGSACSSATLKPSHVLLAMGYPPERVHGAIRIGLGRFTTAEDLAIAASRIADSVTQIRAFSPPDPPASSHRDSRRVTLSTD